MIYDFDAVPPPADQPTDDDERLRPQPVREPDEDSEWRSEFRSYLDDPA